MDKQAYVAMTNTIISDQSRCYYLEELLESGAQGGVFKVQDRKNGGIYALKIQSTLPKNEELIIDIMMIQKDQFQNNVAILDKFKYNSYQCVLMEFGNGGNLYSYILNQTQDSEEKLYQIIKQLALGVQQLHQQKMVHRDIKPENIIIFRDNEDQYKICDIGTIKLFHQNFIDEFVYPGTIFYQAPEIIKLDRQYQQQNSNKKKDERGFDLESKQDVWSLAVVIYELLSKQCLFEQPNQDQDNNQLCQLIFNTQYYTEKISRLQLNSQPLCSIKPLLLNMLTQDPTTRINIDQVVDHFKSRQQIIRIISHNASQGSTTQQDISFRTKKQINSDLSNNIATLQTPITSQIKIVNHKSTQQPHQIIMNKDLSQEVKQYIQQLFAEFTSQTVEQEMKFCKLTREQLAFFINDNNMQIIPDIQQTINSIIEQNKVQQEQLNSLILAFEESKQSQHSDLLREQQKSVDTYKEEVNLITSQLKELYSKLEQYDKSGLQNFISPQFIKVIQKLDDEYSKKSQEILNQLGQQKQKHSEQLQYPMNEIQNQIAQLYVQNDKNYQSIEELFKLYKQLQNNSEQFEIQNKNHDIPQQFNQNQVKVQISTQIPSSQRNLIKQPEQNEIKQQLQQTQGTQLIQKKTSKKKGK